MNIELVRAVATSTERSGQPEPKTSAQKIAAYDPTAPNPTTGLTADKRIIPVEKPNAFTPVDTSVASSRVPDSTAFSRPALVLAKLSQVAETDPAALSGLLRQGASEIESAAASNSLQDPERMRQIAAHFAEVAASHSVADLDPTKLQGSTPADNSLTTALLARADAILGIAPAPYGPWFPRY